MNPLRHLDPDHKARTLDAVIEELERPKVLPRPGPGRTPYRSMPPVPLKPTKGVAHKEPAWHRLAFLVGLVLGPVASWEWLVCVHDRCASDGRFGPLVLTIVCASGSYVLGLIGLADRDIGFEAFKAWSLRTRLLALAWAPPFFALWSLFQACRGLDWLVRWVRFGGDE